MTDGQVGRRAAGARWRLFPLLLCLAVLPSAARAQTDARLVQALRSAQEGQGDSARAEVQRLLDSTPPTDTLYPQILYTQAMVADNAADMRRSLQRVAVEYPTSEWVDDALLRLVQMDFATRSLDAAARNLERLRRDYPLSPLFPQAAYWAGRIYFDLNDQTRACGWLADGMARVGDNIELQNQLGFMYQRCGAVADSALATDSAPAGPTADGADSGRAGGPATAGAGAGSGIDTAAADSAPRTRPDSQPGRPPASRPRYRIQVAAVATPGAADDAADAAEKLGYPAVIIRERGLYKVRVGAFATREEARPALARIKAGMGGQPFVVAIP